MSRHGSEERIAGKGTAVQDRDVEIATSAAPPRNDKHLGNGNDKAVTVDATLAVLMWMQWLREKNNDTFLPLFADQHKHLVLKGGGGSGKSIFAGWKVLDRCKWEPGHRFLVVRKTAKSLRESCFHQLREYAVNYYAGDIERVPKGKSGDMYITFKNGSEIIFAGLDDVEKLKSIHDITGIWIEEATEISEHDFDQLDIRLRGETKYYKQIIVTFNPISITHWLKKRFFDRKDRFDRVRVHESTYKDNRFLPDEDRETLESFQETNYYYYTVYCLGMWGVVGRTFFNAMKVQAQLEKNIKPVAVGSFAFDYDGLQITNIRWVPEKDDMVKIYRNPEAGRPYVIGGDTAGEGSDAFVGQVLDNITGLQVAVLRSNYREGMDEGIYAHQMYCLGKWYNDALIAVETNFSTHPQEELRRLGYPKFWVREKVDEFTGGIVMAYGFRTTKISRAAVLGQLQSIVRETPEVLMDSTTLEEMLTFTMNEEKQLRPEAEANAHDDCVMALAIAFNARSQQRMTVERSTAYGTEGWTKDMWEDYNRASPAERKMLLESWGRVANKT